MKNNTKKKIVLSIMLPASLMCAIGAATLHNELKPTFGETKTYFIEFTNTTNKFTGSGINGAVDYQTDEEHTVNFGWGTVNQLEDGWAELSTMWSDFWNNDPIHGLTSISFTIEDPVGTDKLDIYFDKNVSRTYLWNDELSHESLNLSKNISFDFNKASPNYFYFRYNSRIVNLLKSNQ